MEVARTSSKAPEIDDPIMLLGCHSIELALKAFLRGRTLHVPYTHDLPELLRACTHAGMPVSRETRECIKLTAAENAVHGFRYFAFANLGRPTQDYLADAADEILAAVDIESRAWPTEAMNKAVLKMRVAKPEPKSVARPLRASDRARA